MKYIIYLISFFRFGIAYSQTDSNQTEKPDTVVVGSGRIELQDNNKGVVNTGYIGYISYIINNYGKDSNILTILDSFLASYQTLYATTLKHEQEFMAKSQKVTGYWDSLGLIHNQLGDLIMQNAYLSKIIDSLKTANPELANKSSVHLVPYTCPDCDGTGQVAKYELCSSCKGAKLVICTKCYGTKRAPCPRCKGSGGYCYLCNGNGYIQCQECNYAGTTACKSCNGAGEVKTYEACLNCKGKGQIMDTAGKQQITDNYVCIKNQSTAPLDIVLWYGNQNFNGDPNGVLESMMLKTLHIEPSQSDCIHKLKLGTLNVKFTYVNYANITGAYFTYSWSNTTIFVGRGGNTTSL